MDFHGIWLMLFCQSCVWKFRAFISPSTFPLHLFTKLNFFYHLYGTTSWLNFFIVFATGLFYCHSTEISFYWLGGYFKPSNTYYQFYDEFLCISEAWRISLFWDQYETVLGFSYLILFVCVSWSNGLLTESSGE